MARIEVGIRELRGGLSSWLDAVERGDELVVTDRGRPVARIVPVGRAASLERLVEAGVLRLPGRPRTKAGRAKAAARGSVAALVSAQRR